MPVTAPTQEPLALPGAGVSLPEKVEAAIGILRLHEADALALDPERGYWLADSGGKDSCVIVDLARRARVAHIAHYNLCPDPPELQRFIRRHHSDTVWERPGFTIFSRVPRNGLPSRRSRWCCELFKERGGVGFMKITGIRAAESPRRRTIWSVLTACKRAAGWFLNPILHWTAADVWKYIRDRGLPSSELYAEGWRRLGCVGCPMARRQQRRQFERWPRIGRLWRKATHKLWARRAGTNQRDGREWYASAFFDSADEYFEWWISAESLPGKPDEADDGCQMGLW